jgi:hypothetical protein
MKYSLRSLMIAVLVLPPLIAVGWFAWSHWHDEPVVRRSQFGEDMSDMIILEPALAPSQPSAP